MSVQDKPLTVPRASTSDDPVQALGMRLAELAVQIDGWTREVVGNRLGPPATTLGGVLEYHFGWRDVELEPLPQPAPTGKLLRPALALLVSSAVCGEVLPARKAAVAVELVHNFSLVHDDIQDQSDLRRHRPAVWTVWGMPQGINAGDALFALAQTTILEQDSPATLAMARVLNETCLRLVEGQYLDLDLQAGRVPLSQAVYESMIMGKTGALFECAARLGALAAGASPAAQAVNARPSSVIFPALARSPANGFTQ